MRALGAGSTALRRRALLALSLLGTLACCAVAAPGLAGADVFTGISLLSVGSIGGGPPQQVEYAHDATISADGRYVAFDGSIGGVAGVWRRDLTTNSIEQVAGGGATHPSLSANGRYVSFTTDEGARLPELSDGSPNPAPSPEANSVYVRDMSNTPAASSSEEAERAPSARAFQIVSAQSGSEAPLRYIEPKGETDAGSSAVGRSAISGDGRRVVFMTNATSDLVAYPALEEEERGRGETPVPHTPIGQVAVRYLETGVTELLSRCRVGCGQGAAAGAAEPVTASGEGLELIGAGFGGASISADGSAVAWNGSNVGQQVPLLSAETLPAGYNEPLWLRLPAITNEARRVSGGSDPESAACASSGEASLPVESQNAANPCQGPFELELTPGEAGGIGFLDRSSANLGPGGSDTPQLSANGEKVAFVSEAVLVSEGSDFSRLGTGNPRDLFVADMAPGLPRTQALKPITQAGVEVAAEDGQVADFAISPDGTQVAFSTIRTIFSLGEPSLISAAPAQPGINELYDADLADETITLVTHGYEGGVSTQPHRNQALEEDPYQQGIGQKLGAFSPAFDEAGGTLVFTSTADNLVYGDGNTPPGTEPVLASAADGADAFSVGRVSFQPQPAPQQISPAPPFTSEPAWTIGATAASQRNGTVLLYVRVPGPGSLATSARGNVLVAAKAGRGRRSRRSRPTVALRGVASATTIARAAEGELLTVVLHLAKPYASLATRPGGFSAEVTLSFAAAGRPTLKESLPVTFANADAAARAAKHRARRARSLRKRKR